MMRLTDFCLSTH